MSPRRLAVLSFALCACLAGGRPLAANLSLTDLLDQYAAGRFDDVVRALSADEVDFDAILEQFRVDGPAWIDAAGPDARARRELVAATVALEAARAGAWKDWKHIQRQPSMGAPPEAGSHADSYQPPSLLYWQAPPLLIEWACERFRRDETAGPVERWWQLAALSIAERSEDVQFLIGDPNIGRGLGSQEIGNVEDEIKHLDHVTPRFPNEMRFVLAQGVARDRVWPEEATAVYEVLADDPDVGGEATMRLGALELRQRNPGKAIDTLERAETLTRDPYVVFLARYFRGVANEQRRSLKEAEAAYRAALAAIPNASSATIAAASLAFRDGRRAEAQQLVGDMLAADPQPPDPWRGFVHADDRFWPQLVGRLRAEIQR